VRRTRKSTTSPARGSGPEGLLLPPPRAVERFAGAAEADAGVAECCGQGIRPTAMAPMACSLESPAGRHATAPEGTDNNNITKID